MTQGGLAPDSSEPTNRLGQTAHQRAAYEQAEPDLSLLRVTEAEPGHFAPLGDLTIRAYEPVMVDLYSSNYASTLTEVAQRAAQQTVLVALFGDFAIGGVTYLGAATGPGFGFDLDLRPEPVASFDHLAVDPSAQRLGAGRALVEACISRARDEQRRAVLVTTRSLMTAARDLLEATGFTSEPAPDDACPDGDRRWTHSLELT